MDLKLVSLSVVACVLITLLDQASSSPIAEADRHYGGGTDVYFIPSYLDVSEAMDLKLVSLCVVACVCMTLLDQASSSPIAEADGHYGGHGHGHGYGKGYGGHDKYGYGHDKYGYVSMHAEIYDGTSR